MPEQRVELGVTDEFASNDAEWADGEVFMAPQPVVIDCDYIRREQKRKRELIAATWAEMRRSRPAPPRTAIIHVPERARPRERRVRRSRSTASRGDPPPEPEPPPVAEPLRGVSA